MLRTDIFQRGVPWMLLMKRSRIAETDLNVRHEQKVRRAVAATAWAVWPSRSPPGSPWLLAGLSRGLVPHRRAEPPISTGSWPVAEVGVFAAGRGPATLRLYCCCGVSVVIALGLWHLACDTTQRSAAGADVASRTAAVRSDRPRRIATPLRLDPDPGTEALAMDQDGDRGRRPRTTAEAPWPRPWR